MRKASCFLLLYFHLVVQCAKMSQILFEDHIGVSSLNDAGKKFERGTLHKTSQRKIYRKPLLDTTVNRLHGRSRNYDLDFVLGKRQPSLAFARLNCVLNECAFFFSSNVDVNCELFECNPDDSLHVLLAS